MNTFSRLTRDPLLVIAKAFLWLLMGSMVIGIAASLIAIPLLYIFQDDVTAELARQMPLVLPEFFTVVSVILVLAAMLCAVLFRIFQLLKRIVDTVGEGDPFVPENARRLTHMAWLSLVVQLLGLPLAALGAEINRLAAEHGPHTRIDTMGGISGNGLLLILILFILARVFRKGAEMRAELEGTV